MTNEHVTTRRTLTEQVCDLLRQDILTRRLKPGSRVTVGSIAERYDTSPIPVREAFQTLSSEKLLDISPFKGATVHLIDAKFVSDTYDIMRALEGLAMEDVADHLDDALIAELTALNEGIPPLIGGRTDSRAFSALNRAFHDRIESFCRNERALALLGAYRHIVWTLWEQYPEARASRAEAAYREHADILDALRSGDMTRAQNAYVAHSMSAKRRILASWTANLPND